MRVLTLSPDSGDLKDPSSSIAQRFIRYGTVAERFDVIAPGYTNEITPLSPHVTIYSIGSRSKFTYPWGVVRTLGNLARTQTYDVISTRDTYYLGFVAWILAKRHTLALEIQVHGFEKLSGIRSLLAHFLLRRANSIRTVSHRLEQKLITEFRVAPEAITVCPVFIDYEKIYEHQKAYAATPESTFPFTFLTVGRLVPIKNIQIQLEAIARLRSARDVRLLIVGDGPLRATLEKIAQDLHVEDAVEFCGTQKDLAPFFAKASCFLLTSHEEGYGMAPIEAACAGLPVIMTDVGCAHETLIAEQNALIIPINDGEALIVAMERMIREGALRDTMRKHRSNLYERLPSQETTLQRYKHSWKLASHRASHS